MSLRDEIDVIIMDVYHDRMGNEAADAIITLLRERLTSGEVVRAAVVAQARTNRHGGLVDAVTASITAALDAVLGEGETDDATG